MSTGSNGLSARHDRLGVLLLSLVRHLVLGGLDWRLRGWFRRARRFRGGWLICLGSLPDEGPHRPIVAYQLHDEVRSATMRDFTLPWCVCRLGSCGACGLSYPQPPDVSPHGCNVCVDRDPPV